MPALITQTLEEDLKVLLIARSTSLARLLAKKISLQTGVKVVLIEPEQLDAEAESAESWYKVLLLFENKWDEDLDLLNKLCFLPARTMVIMPFSTAIVASIPVLTNQAISVAVSAWNKQSESEQNLLKYLVKKIDISRFLFYKDLVSAQESWFNFICSQLDRQILLDPEIELSLINSEELAVALAISIFKPARQPLLIAGKKISSRLLVSEIRRLYLVRAHLNLPIKKNPLHSISRRWNKFLSLAEIKKKTGLKPLPRRQEVGVETAQLYREIVSLLSDRISVREKTFPLPPPSSATLTPPSFPPQSKPNKKMEEGEAESEKGVTTSKSESSANATIIKTPQAVSPTLVDSLFGKYRQQQKQQHLKKLTKKTRIGLRKVKGQKFLFGGGIIMSLLALSILIASGIFLTSLSQAQKSFLTYLESFSVSEPSHSQATASMKKTVERLESKLSLVNQWFSIPFFSQPLQLIKISQLILKLETQQGTFQKATADYFSQVMTQTATDSLDVVNKESVEVYKTLSLISAELKNYSLDKLAPEQAQLITDYHQSIKAQEKKINQYQQLAPLLSSLLAKDGTKTYALVLQNDQELRPTGGFIQAVALLTFKNGALINYQVEDVYTLDQQLKATITPPEEVQRFLGEQRWFLRDSNWNPSFPQSAAQIKWFLEKSIAVRVDGVIGINLRVLKEVLTVLDQVEVEEYNEVLTKRNLAERMEFHSEVQLDETTGKRDYSELVLLKILTQLQHLPAAKTTPLLSSLAEMADNKELLIAIFDADAQATFESLGWDGSMIEPACPTVFTSGECLTDSLMQVEANVGVNKANYYLERQIDHSITIASQQIKHKRVITYKNKAQTNAWPKGPYRAYVRFYLPTEADFHDIKINNQSVPLSKLVVRKELGKKVVGVSIEVAVKSELKLQLEYSLTYTYQAPFTYSFFDQKQPGARDVSPRIFITHQPDLSPTLIAPQAEVEGDVIVFNPSKDKGHLFVGVSFD